MAQSVFNIAKGRGNQLHLNAQSGNPVNSAIVIVAIASTNTVEELKDSDTLAAVLALTNTAEVTNTGYTRKVLTTTDLNALVLDDAGNKQTAGFANNQTWSAVASGDNWTHLLFCYDPDSTSGTDATLIPITFHDFTKTPDGSDIVLNAGDYYSAGE